VSSSIHSFHFLILKFAANVESAAEKEAFLKQTSILEETILILKRQLLDAIGSEKAYKAQVDLYSSKYGEFTKTFEGYKTDMTKMSKKTFKMEKEMLQWKIKYEKANAMLLDLISEKQVRDEHITKTAKQLYHLQKLCRTLSAEKKAFYGKLVECNIEVPEVTDVSKEEVPEAPAEPAVPDKSAEKLDEMIKNRDDLRKNLEQLQGQLTTAIAEDAVDAQATAGGKKKSKKAKKGPKQQNGIANGSLPEGGADAEEEKPTEEVVIISSSSEELPPPTVNGDSVPAPVNGDSVPAPVNGVAEPEPVNGDSVPAEPESVNGDVVTASAPAPEPVEA